MEAKKQKYCEAKTELEFPFPMHIINEIIPQLWLLAHYVKISAVHSESVTQAHGTDNTHTHDRERIYSSTRDIKLINKQLKQS